MIAKLLNIICLVLLIACVCVLIRTVKAEPAVVPAVSSDGTTVYDVPKIDHQHNQSFRCI